MHKHTQEQRRVHHRSHHDLTTTVPHRIATKTRWCTCVACRREPAFSRIQSCVELGELGKLPLAAYAPRNLHRNTTQTYMNLPLAAYDCNTTHTYIILASIPVLAIQSPAETTIYQRHSQRASIGDIAIGDEVLGGKIEIMVLLFFTRPDNGTCSHTTTTRSFFLFSSCIEEK
jgi:hypothetical protein